MSPSLHIPNKSLFKLNEVCGLTGVKPYVLRFWESEFEQINPVLSASGQKLYEPKDIEAIALIKQLLFEEKLSIEKAKQEFTLRVSTERSRPLPKGEQDLSDSTPREEELPEIPPVSRELHSQDIEKLVMAKRKLSSLIEFTDAVKKAHDWS